MTIDSQLNFILELEKLKGVIRQTILLTGERQENTAEHSWHIAIAALTLAPFADKPIDISRVVKMLLIHDIIEIDAGDTFAFDKDGYEDKFEREKAAADRIFGLLPDEQGEGFKSLWLEFEMVETNDSEFANAIDRLLPFLQNVYTEGQSSWVRHGISVDQVIKRNEISSRASKELWATMQKLIERSVEQGWLKSG